MTRSVPTPATLPPLMPRYGDHFGRKLCRWIVRISGWHLQGTLPDCEQLVLIGAPHSSWWDGIWGLLIRVGMGAKVHFMIKDELLRGPLAMLLRKLGAIPIDRRAARGVVDQMIDRFEQSTPLWLALTPEGTRKPVARWKSGFWHITHRAGVPVFPVAFHYPEKAIVLGPLFFTTTNMQNDVARLRAFYAPYQGRHHGV